MTEAKSRWTVLEMLKWTTDYLQQKGFENSRLNVEWLLSYVLQYRRLDLYANYDRPLTALEVAEFKATLKRRLAQEPLQYIIGETEFYGYRFRVTPDVLIPRPDTEVLVEKVLSHCLSRVDEPLRILDVGTGSGNIAIALAGELTKRGRSHQIVAIDQSADAISIARDNAARLGVETIEFQVGSILDDAFCTQFSSGFHVLVSNPPYLSGIEYAACPEEVRNHEPRAALDGGENGLMFYERLASAGRKWILQNGSIWLEVGYDQAASVERLFRAEGYVETQLANDYNGIPRVVHITVD